MSKRALPALTGVRFFLALWVVFYHYGPPFDEWNGAIAWIFAPLQQTGYAAVTAFFLLSGFVLAYNYSLTQPFASKDLWKFAGARFSRIYPAYLCGLLLTVPFALYRWKAGIDDGSLIYEPGSFVLNLFLLQAWSPDRALTWNYPGWSLSNEAFFYVCFPFVGVLLWRIRHPAALWAALGLAWAIACLGPLTAASTPMDSFWSNFVRFNPLIRIPEFCTGILVLRLFLQVPERLHGRGSWIYGSGILLVLALILFGGKLPFLLFHNGLLLPAFALVVLGLALGGGVCARWLSTPSFQLLGNASYSLYILHAPLALWFGILTRRLFGLELSGWAFSCSYIPVAVLASCLFFRFLEEPLHRALRIRMTQTTKPPLAAHLAEPIAGSRTVR